MNGLSRYVFLIFIAMATFNVVAMDEPSDTVYFYSTWRQVLYEEADTMIVDPVIDVYSPFEIYVVTSDKKLNNRINKEFIAATLGDSTWLVNSHYVKKNFKGSSKKLHGYVPLFFNDKVAYAVAEEYSYAEIGDMGFNVISTYNYYIDFDKRKVIRIDAKAMDALLSDYPDLRMRYEGFKDNERSAILNMFFYQYVDRVNNDTQRPYILDLVE